MVSRRIIMSAGALAAAGLSAPAIVGRAEAQAARPAADAPPRQSGWYRYTIGDVEVTAIHDGHAMRPLEGFVRNAELADVKKAMADAFLPEAALPITFTTLVLRTGGKTVLIDTGNGNSGAPTTGRWMVNFQAAGFDPAQVDAVIISHFHGDHINGLRLKDGTAVFPKAEISVPDTEWAYWTDDAKMSAAPDGLKPAFQNVRRVFGPLGKDVKTFAAGKEVAPGLTAVAAPGHTPGHTAFTLSSGGGKLMILSDLTNHPALFARNPTWAAVFDMDADKARETRIRMLDMAATEKAQLAFYHAPFPATGFIQKDGSGFRFVPAQWM
ncbi:MBL fold metallo-hydrolase [Enterovirga rhinocerotis]|uniref:Glyoxylase-like metal-dependent hydrolase (Beta-lactamase superfamily II) n=1 Tax=Enterovirga rhinocerotis TaxID=1339210 RepID=A0A4R7CCK7_9HYPH|nr:MBL fold metallo-hydrolase [Enterovirga rhinocerotis]TDR94547.1 glyoxylase-like metal-dependent hydrolase (beta-lactamase superfamily II) [Enterovirga rhinocerotis]